MKLVQLLSGAAAVALIAGAASAQTVSVDAVAGDFIGQTVMSERTGALSGDVVLDMTLDGVFAAMGAGGQVQVDVALTNATFSGIVPANAWNAATDTDCSFGAPSLGGGAGGTSVRFVNQNQINLCDAALGVLGSADDGFLTLPLSVTTLGQDVSVTVTFTPIADAGGYTGAAEIESLLSFTQAYNFTIAAGAASSGLFDAIGDDLLGTGEIGSISLAALPVGVREDLATPVAGFATASTGGVITVTFPSGADGIGSVTYKAGGGDVACAQGVAPADNEFTCALSTANVDAMVAGSDLIDIADDGDPLTTITVQTPTVEVAFTDAASYDVADVAAANVGELELDDNVGVRVPLGPNGAANSFPWTNLRSSGGTQSNFRITGLRTDLAQDSDECIRVTVSNSSDALPGAATACLDAADVTIAADGVAASTWTASFNSTAVANALGITTEAVNGDISFDVVTNDSAAAGVGEIARLLLKNGIVTGTGFDN
ncbi:hypothetical protein [Maricaulis maris]|uniref:hypothetical protein n=1 Tax=Maricaulis maris TaxID=74318 RepID=UPI00292195D2|nr:hypothetical protein MACH15_24500 [Maricaulis maris]